MSNVIEFQRKLNDGNMRLYGWFLMLAVEIHKQNRIPTSDEIDAMIKALQGIQDDLPPEAA